jgi:hypothetical protein
MVLFSVCITKNPKPNYESPSFTYLLTPCSVGRTKISVHVRGACLYFVTKPVFKARNCQHLAQTPSWRTTDFRQSSSAYSIYSTLPSISEVVPPPATWGRAMPWWDGPTYHDLLPARNLLTLRSRSAPCVGETTWISLCQMNTDKFTHILLNHNFINAALSPNVSIILPEDDHLRVETYCRYIQC